MNQYRMTSVPFYHRKKSSYKLPKIVIIEYHIDFDYLEKLATSAGVSETKENLISVFFNILSNEKNLIELGVYEFYPRNADYDHFYKELDILTDTYKRIVRDLYNALKTLNLYNESFKLEYQFGTFLDDNTMILYKPTKEDVG